MAILRTLLLPIIIFLTWLYGLIIWIRNYLFNIGLFKSVSFSTPIISVGNITTGGTGKTPMVIYLAKILEKYGCKPGIVSRGYGRSSKGIIMVHDGKDPLVNVDISGDEPYLIGKELNTIPVVVSENRIAGIYELLKNSPVDIVILDDAFQHRKVKRDMDIVMISTYDKPYDYHLLPWGKLREPIRNLKRAQCVIYSRTIKFRYPYFHKNINPHLTNPAITSIMQTTLMKIDDSGYHKALPVDVPVFAFCGIGNSDSFIHILKEMGLNVIGKRIFQDHQKYTSKILQNLSVQIQSINCRAVVTTEKDIIKIPEIFLNKFIFYVVKITIVLKDDSIMINNIKPIFPNLS